MVFVLGEKLFAKNDSSSKAIAYDKFSVRISQKIKNENIKSDELVDHVPVELSSLILHFLSTDENGNVTVKVTGKRKREIGLILPC